MKTADNEPRHEEPPMTSRHEWSFFEGGGLDRLLRWVRLSGDAPAQVRRRVAVFVLVAWLPPLVLSGVGGQLIGGGLAVPFLLDVEAHVRFLVALPLLIIAEVEVHRRMPLLMSQFAERRLVPEHALPRFEAALASSLPLSTVWASCWCGAITGRSMRRPGTSRRRPRARPSRRPASGT
jgi:hypothetical protein